MGQMKESKGAFALEDDYLYQALDYIIYEKGERISAVTAHELYGKLLDAAGHMPLPDFDKRYKSARSVTARIRNVKKDLAIKFKVEIVKSGKKQLTYSFGRFVEAEEPPIHYATREELIESGQRTQEDFEKEDELVARLNKQIAEMDQT
jgi:hypothetical protein